METIDAKRITSQVQVTNRFWNYGWKDKTPRRRYPGKRTDNTVSEGEGKIDPGLVQAHVQTTEKTKVRGLDGAYPH